MHCKASDCFNCPYPDCINPEPLKIRVYTPAEKKRNNAAKVARYHDRLSQGLCPTCGRKRTDERFVQCLECRLKKRIQSEKYNRKVGKTPRVLMDGIGLCKHCGKAKPEPRGTLCEKCHERSAAWMREWNNAHPQKRFWEER